MESFINLIPQFFSFIGIKFFMYDHKKVSITLLSIITSCIRAKEEYFIHRNFIFLYNLFNFFANLCFEIFHFLSLPV